MSSKLSAAIRAGLAIKRISQNQLAEALEVSGNTVSSWVNDKHLPDQESLFELTRFFEWSDAKVRVLLEDWFENAHSNKVYRLAGAEFVQSKYNGDYELFLKDLIRLDESTILGINQEHEGTPEQWAPIFFHSPYTWRLLISGDEIVGYWHFACLKDELFAKMLSGEMVDSEINVDMLDFPVVEGKYKGYFTIITTRAQDRGPVTINILKSSIEKTISEFARSEILFSEFCATAFSFEGKRMCELIGMKYQCRHPRANDDEVADIYLIHGKDVPSSYWGKNSVIRGAYRKAFK